MTSYIKKHHVLLFELFSLIAMTTCQQFLFEPGFQNAMQNARSSMIGNDLQYNMDVLRALELFLNSPYKRSVIESSKSINAQCIENLIKNELQYIDPAGKPGAGVLLGNGVWYGSYDQCISIPDSHYCSMRNIVLKLASANHTFFVPVPLFGICVPNTCSLNDVKQLLVKGADYVNKTYHKDIITFTNPIVHSVCYSSNNRDYTTGAKVMLFISGLLLCLCFFGTAAEMMDDYQKKHNPVESVQSVSDPEVCPETNNTDISIRAIAIKKKENKFVSFITCFSIIRNTNALFNTEVPNGSITCINGIRTISITWVILGHLFSNVFIGDNSTYLLRVWTKRFSIQVLSNAFVSVDSFFVLSGLLVSYLSLKRFERYGKLPLLRYYVHRYIRLTSSYVFLIFFITYVYPYFHYGPNWVEEPDKNCRKYWWTNLLYINNIYPKESTEECYGVSWYLSNDMQFYVISPAILYVMYKLKWIGVIVASAPFFIQYLLTNGLIVGLNDESPILIAKQADINQYRKYFQDVYFKPWTRFAPYLIGLILGYILLYQKPQQRRIRNTILYLIGWIIAIGYGMAVVYGPYTDIHDHFWGKAENIIYSMFFRIAWSIALAWVIFACHNGYGGLIDDFLSWKAFIPLSRLTYGVYLIHVYVIQFYFQTIQTPFHATEIEVAFAFIPCIVISYIASYFVAIIIEYPVFNLEKLFLNF